MSVTESLKGDYAQYCKLKGDQAERALREQLAIDGPATAPETPQQWARMDGQAAARRQELAQVEAWRSRERAAREGTFLYGLNEMSDASFGMDPRCNAMRREAMKAGLVRHEP